MRVLGSSTVRTLPWQAVMFATGNNVVLPEDTRRRVLVSRLESALENPEDRDDVRDLPAYVAGARRELVRAGLTVLRAYASHGRPSTGGARWGSFEEWSALVPPAIVFAGGPDALATRPRGDGGDDDATATAALLERLPMLSDAPMTAKQIVALLWPADRGDAPDMHDPLREAIEQLCPPRFGARPEAKALGERLRRMSGRVIGGRRIVSRSSHSHAREWSVEVVA
jgi:putative DNA primase/helicase